VVKDAEDSKALAGSTVTWLEKNITQQSNSEGLVEINGIPNGIQHFKLSHIGYEDLNVSYLFPLDSSGILQLLLERLEAEEEEVIVSATRTSRTIADNPMRVEVISGEELAEKANMKPGDIRMLLNETTGIQTQQTSATSYNSSIRIQGLDGRYTQILKDGYPLYAGFSGGLSILQIAPLDLRQVEVIKGSSSTLYGGGAIAGLVNLVSKTPGEDRDISFIANGTSAGGLDLSAFYSERYGKSGITIFGARNSTRPYDPGDNGLTAIPKAERYTINPRLFLYGKNNIADIGLSYMTENRIGGNMNYIRHGGTGYYEKNNTERITATAGYKIYLGEKSFLSLKSSYSKFDRHITIPDYEFQAVQASSFSEFSWNRTEVNTHWIAGLNLVTDQLKEEKGIGFPARDYKYYTFGTFVQNSWKLSPVVTIETGLRGDFVKEAGFEILPRISGLFKLTPELTSRIGGGLGYKTPTVFTEESERMQYRRVLPVDIGIAGNERSSGANLDFNFRKEIGRVNLTLNQLFYYTRINRPLILIPSNNNFQFLNADGHIETKGMETNLRLIYRDFKFFLGYTYTDAGTHFNGSKSRLPLTARHRLNNVLMYEIEDKLKLGLEAYYFSPQQLSDGNTGKQYWIMGFMAEKIFEKIAVFINFENFTDTRQTRFDTIYSGSIDQPVFRDIYAPVDGFVVNGGIKLKL
jgi:iron complex outermembrane receptor protein